MQLNNLSNEAYILRVSDVSGRTMTQLSITVNAAYEQIKLSLDRFPNGNNIFQLTAKGQSFSQLVQKQ